MKLKTIKNMLLALVAFMAVGCNSTCSKKAEVPKFDNAFFYDANGKFDVEKAKDAIIALMKYHNYPEMEGIREKLWITDYGKGQFAKLGLAAVVFANNEKDRYMLLDIYLLPGQFLPEHYHLATEKNPVKMEGWLIRNGSCYVGGEGESNLPEEVVIPECHMDGKVTVNHCTLGKPGMFLALNRPTAHHWLYAGNEGAILTESANVHDNAGVRHQDKGCDDFFRGK